MAAENSNLFSDDENAANIFFLKMAHCHAKNAIYLFDNIKLVKQSFADPKGPNLKYNLQ